MSTRVVLPRRGLSDAWLWMRVDVPTRVAFLIAAPLVWIAVAGIDPSAIGLTLQVDGTAWLMTAVWAVMVLLVTLAFRRWLWPVRHAPRRSALAPEVPFFALLNPVAEELFFRGAALFGLANLVGMPWSIAITSVVFGFHHALARFPLPFLVLGTLGGVLFGIAAAMTGSIAPAIVLHAVADLMIFVGAAPLLERLQVGLVESAAPRPANAAADASERSG